MKNQFGSSKTVQVEMKPKKLFSFPISRDFGSELSDSSLEIENPTGTPRLEEVDLDTVYEEVAPLTNASALEAQLREHEAPSNARNLTIVEHTMSFVAMRQRLHAWLNLCSSF